MKFIMNDSGIVFLSAGQQHRDVKVASLSYEDDYLGNAVAGLITPERTEIRFHNAYSDERIRALWIQLKSAPELASLEFRKVYYQGREVR